MTASGGSSPSVSSTKTIPVYTSLRRPTFSSRQVRWRRRGFNASLKPSPTRLKASTAVKMATRNSLMPSARGGLHGLLLAEREELRAHQPRCQRPAEDGQHRDDLPETAAGQRHDQEREDELDSAKNCMGCRRSLSLNELAWSASRRHN
jgi:hypothetical protein